MKLVPMLTMIALLAGCFAAPARYSLDVSATRLKDQGILVQAKILDHGTGGDTEIILPKVLVQEGQTALVHVGDESVRAVKSDGVHGTITATGEEVLFQASVVESGLPAWRGERRVRVQSDNALGNPR